MRPDPTRNSRPLLLTALTAVALCTLGLQTAQGASADRAGRLPRKLVAEALPAHAGELSACLARATAGSEEVHMQVSYLIKTDGTVADIAIPEAEPYRPELERCVKDVVADFRFPHSGRPVLVNAPVVFKSGAPAG